MGSTSRIFRFCVRFKYSNVLQIALPTIPDAPVIRNVASRSSSTLSTASAPKRIHSEYRKILYLRISFVIPEIFYNVAVRIFIYRAVAIFGEFFYDIFFVYDYCVRIEHLIVSPAPIIVIHRFLSLYEVFFVPFGDITGDSIKPYILSEAFFGMDSVDDDGFAIPFFTLVSDGDCNFDEFAVVFRKIGVVSRVAVLCGVIL